MEVTDFLDLQGAFQTSRVLIATTHDKQTPLVVQGRVGEILQGLVQFENLFDLSGECQQPLDDLVASRGKRNPIFGQLERHHQQRNELRRVCLTLTVSNLLVETLRYDPR